MRERLGSRFTVLLALTPMILALGCAESQKVQLNPVWSATVPSEGAQWTKTVNVFPLYSKNQTAFSDRIEETGNVLLFISWSKVVPMMAVGLGEPVRVTPAGGCPVCAQTPTTPVPGMAAAPIAAPAVVNAFPAIESTAPATGNVPPMVESTGPSIVQ